MEVFHKIKEKSGSIFFIILFTVFVVIPIIRINISPPTAEFSIYPSTPLEGEIINFNARGSHAEGSIKITSYEWDFGDGYTGSGLIVNHTYSKGGEYEVELTVTNERGKSSSAYKEVTIELPLAEIKLEVLTSTYLNNFSRGTIMVEEDIRSSLRRACFHVVPEASTSYDTKLLVDYKEKKYGQFVNEKGIPVGGGTKIECSIKLYGKEGNLLYEKELSAATSAGTYFDSSLLPDLYGDALYEFKYNVYFKYLGNIIATRFGISDEFSVLVSALNDDVSFVRSNAIDSLREMDKTRAVEPITGALLNDEESSVRIHAAEALGEIGGERVVEPLIEALKDEDSLVRAYVVSALGKVGFARAIEPLTDLLNDESDIVRRNVEEALEYIRSN